MLRGRRILEHLFPGLDEEMIRSGALLLDLANEIAWLTPFGWGAQFTSDLKVLAFTRPLLDLLIRRQLEANPQISILSGTQVDSFLPKTNGRWLYGVLALEGSLTLQSICR